MDRATETALINECVSLSEQKLTELAPAPDAVSPERYLDAAVFTRELERIFKSRPLAVGLASALPSPGDYVARDWIDGIPLLLVRGQDRQVRAFLNICSHRGMRVVEHGAGCRKRFSCPYHAWTYDDQGALTGGPQFDLGFGDLDKKTLGLTELPCRVVEGMVFVHPDPAGTIPADIVPRELVADMQWLKLAEHRPFETTRKTWKMNWKTMIEGGAEAYHFNVAHKDSLASFFLGNLSTRVSWGAFTRQVLPKRTMLDVPLLSELLQAKGYRTLLQGKWHLGEVPGASDDEALPPPNRRGFDEFVGIVGAQAAPYRLDPASHPYTHNGKPLAIEPDWYAVEGLNRVTMSLLDSLFQGSPETPFFLYVASQAPHKPVDAPDELVAKYRTVYAQPLETLWQARVDGLVATGLLPAHAPLAPPRFTEAQRERLRSTAAQRAAMLEAADTALGELVDLLKRRGKLDDTLIIVASDNGAAAEAALLANAPFRGAKGNLWEGATLSPLVATWKNGGLTQRGRLREPVSYLDIMPTVLEAAGIEYPVVMPGNEAAPQLPGVSFLPALRGEPQQPMPDFYWNLYGRFAVLHEGRWKLHAAGYSEARERRGLYPPLKLFDLQADPAETRDVSAENPELVQALLQRYEAWAEAHHAVEYYRVLDAYAANRRAIERERQQKLQEAVRKLMSERPGDGK